MTFFWVDVLMWGVSISMTAMWFATYVATVVGVAVPVSERLPYELCLVT